MVSWVFPYYLAGMALALLLNVTHLRAFALRLFYATVIVSAHFYFTDRTGYFYVEAGTAQFFILVAALSIRCEAAFPIAGLAFIAVVANFLAYLNYPSHDGIWPYYYGLINGIQVSQILCLLTVSPVTLPWIRKILHREKGKGQWMALLLGV